MSASFYVGGVLFQNGDTICSTGLPTASTLVAGIVQLNDTTSSTCTNQAATANAVKNAYDLANGAVPNSTFSALGDLIVGTGAGTYGNLVTGANGTVLSANSACALGVEWITVSGGSGTVTSITAGTGLTGGTITTSGTIALDATCVIAPTILTAKGSLISASAASTPVALAVGTNGQVLTACSTCTSGITWVSPLTGYTCAATPFNTAVGTTAGDSITSGTDNTSLGFNAGTAITSGFQNTLVGSCAGDGSTTQCGITAVGYNAAGGSAATGTTAIGANALAVATGANNTAVGYNAGASVALGNNNTLVGFEAGDLLSSAPRNTAVGACALGSATSPQDTVAIGFCAAGALLFGCQNTVVGSCAGAALTNGNPGRNVALGYASLLAATTATCNTAIGAGALSAVTGGNNVALGHNAGNAITTGTGNVILGPTAGSAALTNNVVIASNNGIKLQLNENGALGVGSTPGYGTTGQILVSNGTGAAPTWTTSAQVPASYGSFLRTTTQTNLDTTNGNVVTFDTTVASNNFTLVSGSQITAGVAGVYSVIAAYQVQKTDAGSDDINVWFKKNGANIPNTGSNLTLVGNNSAQLATTPWIVTLAAGDYIEAWWWSLDVNSQLLGEPAAAPYPVIPSVNIVIMPVGA